MSNNKGLGKGLDSLVPVGTNIDIVTTQPHDKIHHLAIDIVQPKVNQPRQHFNEQLLEQLAQSIREQGILQPIIVVETEQNKYAIIAGERRWRAAQLAGLNKVPAIIRAVDDLEHLELSLLENIQRADLNPIETAHTIHRLHHEFQQSYEDIAKRLGKAYTTVVNAIRLLQLPKHMQDGVMSGQISEGHARALLSLAKDPVSQEALYQKICQQHLSVRQAEIYVKAHKSSGGKNVKVVSETTVTHKELSNKFSTTVKIKKSANGGSIIFSASSSKKLDELINKFL
jgi:ParB family transcriptional regulator, chromosome partitioning protein